MVFPTLPVAAPLTSWPGASSVAVTGSGHWATPDAVSAHGNRTLMSVLVHPSGVDSAAIDAVRAAIRAHEAAVEAVDVDAILHGCADDIVVLITSTRPGRPR